MSNLYIIRNQNSYVKCIIYVHAYVELSHWNVDKVIIYESICNWLRTLGGAEVFGREASPRLSSPPID